MPNFANKVHFRRSSWKVIKSDLKLVFGVLVQSITNEHDAMPYCEIINECTFEIVELRHDVNAELRGI